MRRRPRSPGRFVPHLHHINRRAEHEHPEVARSGSNLTGSVQLPGIGPIMIPSMELELANSGDDVSVGRSDETPCLVISEVSDHVSSLLHRKQSADCSSTTSQRPTASITSHDVTSSSPAIAVAGAAEESDEFGAEPMLPLQSPFTFYRSSSVRIHQSSRVTSSASLMTSSTTLASERRLPQGSVAAANNRLSIAESSGYGNENAIAVPKHCNVRFHDDDDHRHCYDDMSGDTTLGKLSAADEQMSLSSSERVWSLCNDLPTGNDVNDDASGYVSDRMTSHCKVAPLLQQKFCTSTTSRQNHGVANRYHNAYLCSHLIILLLAVVIG